MAAQNRYNVQSVQNELNRAVAGAYSEKPYWLAALLRQNEDFFGARNLIGVRKSDLDTFVSKLIITLRESVPDPVECGRNVIDIDSKEFRNNGSEMDTFKLKTQTTDEIETKKTYQLSVGKNITVGGEAGLEVGAKFFNVGGVGVSAKGSASRAKNKEEVAAEETTRSLSQVYGFDGDLQVPPKTFVKVRITTYAVSYSAKVQLLAEMPEDATLEVLAPRTGFFNCCRNRKVYITAEDFLRVYTETSANPRFERGLVKVDFAADLRYLGEVTKVDKEREEAIVEED
uniref:Uncharacterized protein n=1 Tax=Amphimedon queenslandica TaxID=400682 RepID=A0A1X7UR02_AMPQE